MLWQSLHMASKVELLVMRGVWLTHVIRGDVWVSRNASAGL